VRSVPLALGAALFCALLPAAAYAAPASVSVKVGPKLEELAKTKYGAPEIERLAQRLELKVSRSLSRREALADARVELVLEDAVPNRPTFKQLGDTPGLSFESFGVGGARISGRMITADGTVTPISFKWYETDIRQAQNNWTWSDAEWAFDRFAVRLTRDAAPDGG
jgi:hypothetical protein